MSVSKRSIANILIKLCVAVTLRYCVKVLPSGFDQSCQKHAFFLNRFYRILALCYNYFSSC